MRFYLTALILAIFYLWSANAEEQGIPASEALKKLKEGNLRFVEERVIRPNQTFDRVVKVSAGQHPFVSILSCSDSRVPTEMLFDQGFGDIFSVRVAGNVADTDEIGTLEYGTGHLGTKLLVVLGHSKCGAVTAVVKGASVHGHIPALVDNIIPAAKKAKGEGLKEEEVLDRAIELNVLQGIEDILTRSEEIRHLVQGDQLTIIGAVYDISNGRVKWLGEHPDQEKILSAFASTEKKESATKGQPDKTQATKEDLQSAGP